MLRRFLVSSRQRAILFFLLICFGCSAQLAPQVAQRIERQLRVTYSVPPTVKVILSAPHPSEFPNYDGITVTFDEDGQKKTYKFLLSKDQKNLVGLTKVDLSKDPYAELMKKIDIKGRPVRGNPNAKVLVVSYDDFQCPFCSAVHKILFPALLNQYGDRVAFVYKDFPLSGHNWAVHAAVDANCLGAQSYEAYWDFADRIHSHQETVNSEKGPDKQFAALDRTTLSEGSRFKLDTAKLESCVKAQKDDAVRASLKEGESVGVKGTPTLFVNGQKLVGDHPISEFRAAFDSALKDAGVPPPTSSRTPAASAGVPEPSAGERSQVRQ